MIEHVHTEPIFTNVAENTSASVTIRVPRRQVYATTSLWSFSTYPQPSPPAPPLPPPFVGILITQYSYIDGDTGVETKVGVSQPALNSAVTGSVTATLTSFWSGAGGLLTLHISNNVMDT